MCNIFLSWLGTWLGGGSTLHILRALEQNGVGHLYGIEGFILRGRDPQHIAEAMIRVAQDHELCQRMGEAAHKKGGIKNSWQDYGDRLLTEYAKRLNR